MEKDITFLPGDFEFAPKKDMVSGETVKTEGMAKAVLKRFFGIKSAVAGVLVVLIIVLLAIFAPVFSGYRYDEIIKETVGETVETANNVAPTFSFEGLSDGAFKGKTFLFGTDDLGRDLWTRIWRGTRVSLLVALITIIINLAIGLPYGLISGYKGGITDTILQRITEILTSIPGLVIISILALFIPRGMGLVIVVMGITGWVGVSRIVRASTLEVKEMEYVYASRTLGSSTGKILRMTIFPNIIGPIITNMLFEIPGFIFVEAFLSFIGVGITLPDCSLGSLMEQGFESISLYPYKIMPPVIIIALLMIAFNAIGDGFKRALAPDAGDM